MDRRGDISNALIEYYLNSNKKEIVIVCIGSSDKKSSDILGPTIGTKLLESNINFPITIYGSLENPLHALNLEDKIKYINEQHPDAFIISVDACIGQEIDIGKIFFLNVGIKPGKGIGKELPPVGDVSVIGVVTYHPFFFFTNMVSDGIINNLINNTINELKEFINTLLEINYKKYL